MARLQLNKSSLAKHSRDLQSYSRYLPSLDLKRQQLMLEKAKVSAAKAELVEGLNTIIERVKTHLPMLANQEVDLDGLVSTPVVKIETENVVGVALPRIAAIELNAVEYTLLARPHWVDNYVDLMNQALVLKIKIALQVKREALLLQGIKTITQRVNLFEKVLIPRAKNNIKRIKIYFSDEQMSSVVRSKIAKKKRLEKGQ